MSVTSMVEFDNPAEHVIPEELELGDDKGRMKAQFLSSEILFSNFDTDDELTSKRGAKELVLGGANNTGSVSGGLLTFIHDQSIATYENITEIVDDFAVRFKTISLITSPASDREIARLKSNVDLSEINWRYSNQGSGVARLYCKVIDSAGSTVADFILGTVTLAIGTVNNLAVSNDDDGNLLMFYDGALVNTIASSTFNFTDCNLRFGNTGGVGNLAPANVDNVQLFNSHAITEDYSNPFPEPTDYVLTEHVMETLLPLTADSIISLLISHEIPTGSQLTFGFIFNNVKYAYNGTIWAPVDLTALLLPQGNTLAEIQANLDTVPLVEGIGKTIGMWHVFKSDTGYATAEIQSLTIKTTYPKKSADVGLCVVEFEVLDNSGAPVEGATVRVESKDRFVDSAIIGPSAKEITNPSGTCSMSIPETETDGTFVTIWTEYTEKKLVDGVEDDVLFTKKYKRVIPNLPTASFSNLALPA